MKTEACMPVVAIDDTCGVEVKAHGLMFFWDPTRGAQQVRFDILTAAWYRANAYSAKRKFHYRWLFQ